MQTIKPVTKPSKQRKMLYQAPDHVRYKLFAAPLSPELRASHQAKSLPVRSGDTVRILRGDHEGFEGKVTRIDRKNYRIYVEGLTREKVDGTTVFVPIHPSKVMITRLNLDDKWRKKILERKKTEKKVEEVEKPPPKIVEAKEVIEEPMPVKKPRKRKRAAKKPKAKAAEEKEEKTEVKKKRTRRKTARKTEGEA